MTQDPPVPPAPRIGVEAAPEARGKALTWRSLAVGLAGVVALSVISIDCTLSLTGSLASWDFYLETAVFLLLLALVLNGVAGRLWPRLKMGRAELVTVFLMLLVAAPIASIGFVSRLVPALGGVRYYATQENAWERLLWPHVPGWLAPRDMDAINLLFLGLPPDGGIPWGPWLAPLAFWGAFFLALSAMSICLATLLRRQWVERERLAYPIMGLAMELLDSQPRQGEKTFWRNPMAWAGLLAAFIFASLWPLSRVCEEYFRFPFTPPKTDYYWFDSAGAVILRFKFSISTMALTYLVPQDVALSCWLFNVLYQFQRRLYTDIGFDAVLVSETHVWGGPAFSGQAIGAFLFVGVSSFWLARRHLASVWRGLWRPGPIEGEAAEILSYRAASAGLAVSFVAVTGFLVAMGSPVWMALLVLLAAVFCMVAVTKIAIQCGLPWIDAPMPAPTMITTAAGSQGMSGQALASLGAHLIWTTPMRLTEFGTVSHGLKVVDHARSPKKGLFAALLLAVVVGLASAFVFHMRVAYNRGGANFYGWFYKSYAELPWRYAADKMNRPQPPNWRSMGFVVAGAGAAGAMQFMRNTFVWWPFSVVGFAGAMLSNTSKLWFSIFLVWLVKGMLVRYGGQRAYRAGKPLFLGLFLGQIAAQGVWYLLCRAAGLPGSVPW